MIEISLEEFEDFFKDRIDSKFAKIKKATSKALGEIRENMIDIKICMDHFLEAGEEKIEAKAQKSLHFFIDRIKKEIDEIEIPEAEINYDNLNALLNSIKRLFPSINEIARKSLPKFQKEVQGQIKELNYITRKLGNKQKSLDDFLRKKYTGVKEAEDLLKKLPKLVNLRDNIEKAKIDLDAFEKDSEQKKKDLGNLNSELIKLENNELFQKLDTEKNTLFQLRLKINDEIGFKKALKKLKFDLEKGTYNISNINLNYLKEFLKSPIKKLIEESDRTDFPRFSSLMVQLRHALEESKLILKSETKEKTIEQINMIFEEKTLQKDIENYLQIKKRIAEIEHKINDAGLAQKLEDIKNNISSTSVKLEHVEADYNRKNKDYTRYLSNLKKEREEFQSAVEQILEEPIKINITFSF
ncbi:MAG: hypothetical protein ACFFB0_16195 [Promethearchaeota archaeon]